MSFYPNEVIKLDRMSIENDLRCIGNPFKLLDKNENLDDVTFDAIAHELFEGIYGFITSCYSKVEKDIDRAKGDKGAKDCNPHYRSYSRHIDDDNFELEGIFTHLSDARDSVREDKKGAVGYEYLIFVVKDGFESPENLYKTT